MFSDLKITLASVFRSAVWVCVLISPDVDEVSVIHSLESWVSDDWAWGTRTVSAARSLHPFWSNKDKSKQYARHRIIFSLPCLFLLGTPRYHCFWHLDISILSRRLVLTFFYKDIELWCSLYETQLNSLESSFIFFWLDRLGTQRWTYRFLLGK